MRSTSCAVVKLKRIKRAPTEGGFTLLELMVAFVILLIGVVAILQAISYSLVLTRSSANRTHAVLLTEQKMEELLAQENLSEGELSGDFGEAYPQHRWVAEVEPASVPRLKRLTVAVKWRERGREKEFTLTTLIGPDELTDESPE